MGLALLSLIIAVLIPLSAAEIFFQYSGSVELLPVAAHHPVLVLTFILSVLQTVFLFTRAFKKQAPVEQDRSALLLLSLLQEKGRFLDFVNEDIAPYTDSQVSSAARVVHSGCRSIIRDCFAPAPIAENAEGSAIENLSAKDLNKYKLIGKVGQPPYRGKLTHRGWFVKKENLPQRKRSEDPSIISPAEVEVQ